MSVSLYLCIYPCVLHRRDEWRKEVDSRIALIKVTNAERSVLVRYESAVAYRIVSYHAVLCYVLLCAALQFFIVLYSAVLCYILVDLCYISLCSVLCALLVVLCSTDEVCWDGLYRIYFSLSLTFTSPLLIIY